MASRKRSRNLEDVNGEVEVESASSSLRTSFPKRSRVTLARENGGSVVSDDEDEVDGLMHGEWTGGPPAMSDNGGSDDEDEEAFDLRATQYVAKEMEKIRDNDPSEHGVVEEVFCRNFMCHSKLRIKLGPLINFIIGHNGSGKSAVLTALTMCLGGKASATNRGASLKSLIKEGQDNATLAVKIKNRGEGAYKHELYGNSITIERHFNRAGTSGFKLKNANDRIISTKKADLDDIMDYFAFQLDNPINVLTQDMARQFLSNSSPADKYKFFIRGTQLEVLDADYKLMEEHLDSIEAKLFSREQDIAALKSRADEAERKKKRSEQTESIRSKIDHLQKQHAWAQVEEQEAVLETYRTKHRQAEEVVQQKKDAAEGFEGAYEGHNQAFESGERMLAEYKQQLQPLTEKHAEEKAVFDKNKTELLEKVTEERTIKEELKKRSHNVKKRENEIREEQNRLAEAEGPEHAQQLVELEQLKATAQEKQQEITDHESGQADLLRKRDVAQHEVEQGKERQSQAKEALTSADTRLNSLQQNQGREYAAYRPNMEALVKAINNETRWRSRPVGPMGKHIRLLKPEWSSPIERMLGGNAEAFIVTCPEDQALLGKIMQRVRCTSSIFIGNGSRLDTTGKEPAGVDTVLRVLEIDNDFVRNSLIINQYAEQLVLIADRNEATNYLYGDNRPRNVKAVMSFASDRRSAVRFDTTGSGAERSSPVPAWQGPPRITTDLQDQIRIQKEHRDQAFRDHEEAKTAVRNLETACTKAKQEVVRIGRTAKELKTAKQQADDAVEQKQSEIESNQPEDGKLQELERALEEAKQEHQAQQESYRQMVDTKDDLNAKQNEIKPRLDAAQAELDEGRARVRRQEEKLAELENARVRALREMNVALEAIDTAKKEQDRVGRTVEENEQNVNLFVEQATQISRRIPVEDGLSSDAINKRIEKFIKDRQRAEAEAGGTREELSVAFYKAQEEYEEAKVQTQGMETCAKTLKAALTERHNRWKLFRKHISARAKGTFKYLLMERAFRGRVVMNHVDRLLDIKVEPDMTRESDAGRTTKTLSGGEKSFSTICLLLSIWEAMGSPIRCLDEFDVFMDNVNRATSMSMMIQAARRSVGRQFILITPQAMNNVEMGEDVKVHKMSDPERGQTVLPFTQV